MAKTFDYSDPTENYQLIDWLTNHSYDEWQEYLDFVWSPDNTRDFSYDEKNALKSVGGMRQLKTPSNKQFKLINWVYNIVERIDGLKQTSEISEEAATTGEVILAPLRHFTLRVAWHDSAWNGHVCQDPEKNIFCSGYHSLLSDRIRRNKEILLETEKKYAGKPVELMYKETGEIPPCFWSINAFGKSKLTAKHVNPAAKKLDAIEEDLPPFSMFSWPFGFSFVRDNDEYNEYGKYPSNLDNVRAPKFRNKIKEKQSIGFIYSKFSNPLSYEEMKYLVVGVGLISEKGEFHEFGPKNEVDAIRNNKFKRDMRNFPRNNWALRFSFDPETLVRMPYHEYLREAERNSLAGDESEAFLDRIKVTIDEPELEHCFKYVAMDIDDDEAIYLLSKMRAKLSGAMVHGIIPPESLKKDINKLERLIEFCWNRRTHFPGLSNLARVLVDKLPEEKYKLDDFVQTVKDSGPDYDLVIKQLLDDPNSDKDFSKYANELTALKAAMLVLGISTNEFLMLSMVNLSQRQFQKIKLNNLGKQIYHTLKEVCTNPYLLYECYQVDEDNADIMTGETLDYPIELFKIDIALFPNTDYLVQNYLQKDIRIDDKRRIRALIINYLRLQEFVNGNCLEDATNLQLAIESQPLFYSNADTYKLPLHFLLSMDVDFEAHLRDKLHIEVGDYNNYFYLKELKTAEEEVADFIIKLISPPVEDNTLVYEGIGKYISKSVENRKAKIGVSFDDTQFSIERTKLYNNIFPKKFFVITGSPGSGKSYETLNVIRYLKNNGESYLLLAPTGKAALRLSSDPQFKKDKIEAMTIDKFITQHYYQPSKRKNYQNVIIDEMSMVDIIKLQRLINCFDTENPSFHRLVMVGDPHQLPPIGFGKPFYDIIQFLRFNEDYNENHLVDLDVNCRQELEGNLILDFSKLYSNQGDLTIEQEDKISDGGEVSNGFRIEYWKNEDELRDLVVSEWKRTFQEKKWVGNDDELLDKTFKLNLSSKLAADWNFDLENFQILTPYKYFTDVVNDLYQTQIRSGEISILKLFKDKDKIIRTKNYYEKQDLLLSNGSIGLTAYLSKEKILCFPELDEKNIPVYKIRESEKEFFELAYCITVHKAQGSGFENVIVIIPKRFGLLCKELLYTAFTRSKKSITILIEGEKGTPFDNSLFEYARKRTFTERRKTSLLLKTPHQHYGLEPEQGVFVQSRVEQMIYSYLRDTRDELGKEKFNFMYEQYPEVNGDRIRIKTDFTIYTSNKTYYWEHLGRLSIKSYERQWLELKKPTYDKAGLSQQLVTTDELRGINDQKIKDIIQAIISGNVGTEDKLGKYSLHHFSLR